MHLNCIIYKYINYSINIKNKYFLINRMRDSKKYHSLLLLFFIICINDQLDH